MNEIILFLAICALGTAYASNAEGQFLGIKYLYLPFIFLGMAAVAETSSKGAIPAVSLVFLPIVAFITYLVRRKS
jgi:hypothetical protein